MYAPIRLTLTINQLSKLEKEEVVKAQFAHNILDMNVHDITLNILKGHLLGVVYGIFLCAIACTFAGLVLTPLALLMAW